MVEIVGKTNNPAGGPGGSRSNAGRPKGSVNKFAKATIEAAKAQGVLPHEFLLMVVRGEPIEQSRWVVKTVNGVEERELLTDSIYPELSVRIEAAKAVAPYYAPKLATQVLSVKGTDGETAEALKMLAERLSV